MTKIFALLFCIAHLTAVYANSSYERCDKMKKPNLIGAAEKIAVDGIGEILARIDTGAKTISIHGTDLKVTKIKGIDHLIFKTYNDKGKEIELTKRIVRTSTVKSASSKGKGQKRYFVEALVWLNGKKVKMIANVNDRSHMEYKLLIGRNYLRGNFQVDVTKENSTRTYKTKNGAYIMKCLKQNHKLTPIGAIEIIEIEQLRLQSRIDSGASRTSLNSFDEKIITEDGKKFVEFKTETEEGFIKELILPYAGQIEITSATTTKASMRNLVTANVRFGDKEVSLPITLVDRRELKYKILVGRDFLKHGFINDVSKSFTEGRR